MWHAIAPAALRRAALFLAAVTLVRHVTAAAGPGTELQLQLVNDTTCLDGSRAGYYYAPPPTPGSGTWVIYLQSGGACYAWGSCHGRAKSALGSSAAWPPTKPCNTGSGTLLCDDDSVNVGFADAHHVYVPYATGDTYKGTRRASPGTMGFHFTGHTNLVAFFADLDRRHGLLTTATHVLLTGASAGGIGAFVNADMLAALLPRGTVLKAAPNGGFFFPAALPSDAPGHPGYPPSNFSCFAAQKQCGLSSQAAEVQALWGSFVDPACAEAYGDESWLCGTLGALFPFIRTPTFIIQAQFDSEQIIKQQGCPRPWAKSPAGVRDYVAMYGEATQRSLAQALSRDDVGVFMPSCFTHVVSPSLAVGGRTWPAVLADWFWHGGQGNASAFRAVDDCGTSATALPCNPAPGCSVPEKGGAGGGGGGSGAGGGGVGRGDAGDKCRSQLSKDGCLDKAAKGWARACASCATKHLADLSGAGCTLKVVKNLCGTPAPAPAPAPAVPSLSPLPTRDEGAWILDGDD